MATTGATPMGPVAPPTPVAPVAPSGGVRGTLRLLVRTWRGRIGLIGLGLFVLMAIFGPLIAPQDPYDPLSYTSDTFASPTGSHLLGTDELGRDVLSSILYAARFSLVVGLAAAFISTVIGTAVGIISGYAGGWWDRVLVAIDDWFLVIPFIPITVVTAALLADRAESLPFGRSGVLILVIGVLGWAGTSRVVRAEVLTVKERDYVRRSRALGASGPWIMRKHILPNVLPLAFANSVLFVSLSILAAATLAFLGLGDPLRLSWGQMLNTAYDQGAMASGYWWYFIPPGLCITGLVLSFSLVGYAIEEIVNPRLRERTA